MSRIINSVESRNFECLVIKPPKRKKREIYFMVAISLMLFLLACVFGEELQDRGRNDLRIEDFEIGFAFNTPMNLYTPWQLAKTKKVFVHALNQLPDELVKNDLINWIKSGKLKVSYQKKGMIGVWGPTNELYLNPPSVIELGDRLGYLGACLVHEHHHIQDWQGKNQDGLKYRPCEMSHYATKECRIEWLDAEWRALVPEIKFIRKFNYLDQVTAGSDINNRTTFANNRPELAALIYLQENYSRNDETKLKFRKVFPEFYHKKLAEIGG